MSLTCTPASSAAEPGLTTCNNVSIKKIRDNIYIVEKYDSMKTYESMKDKKQERKLFKKKKSKKFKRCQ